MQKAGFDVKSAIAHGYEVECKANTDTNVEGAPSTGYAPYLTQTDTEPARPYQRPLVVADLFATGSITGTVLQYPVFDELEATPRWSRRPAPPRSPLEGPDLEAGQDRQGGQLLRHQRGHDG